MAAGKAGADKAGKKGKAGSKIGGVLTYGLLFLLAVGLVGFGQVNFSGSRNRVATVGDREITVQEFYNRLRNQIDGFSQQAGVAVSFQQAQALGLDQSALGGLVLERALDSEVSRLGIAAGDDRVREVLVSMPQFQQLDGSFDRDTYRRTLQAQATSEAQFENSLRDSLARQLLQAGVAGGSLPQEQYGEVISSWRGERRDIAWAVIGAETLDAALPEPDDAALRAWYDDHPEAYTLPEQRDITWGWLSPDMIMDKVTVDEGDVQALYDLRAAEFLQPERRLVERLVYPDETRAEAAKAQYDSGEASFEDLVNARGLELSDIDLGDVSRDDLGAAADAVFAIEPGEVAGPLDTRLGPALFRVNAALAAQEVTLDEVADDLRGELALQRAQRLIQDESERLIDLIAGGATIEDLAAATDMELGQITWSEGTSDGIAAYEPFRAAAAAAVEGDFPELRQMDDGGVFVLRLDGTRPPELQDFAEVESRVAADWRADAERQALVARADELAEALRSGDDAALAGLAATESQGVRRSDFLEGAPEGLVAAAFDRDEGEIWVTPTPAGAVIARLERIHPVDPADPGIALEQAQIAAEAQQGIDSDIFAAFASRIQLDTRVDIDPAAVEAVYSQLR